MGGGGGQRKSINSDMLKDNQLDMDAFFFSLGVQYKVPFFNDVSTSHGVDSRFETLFKRANWAGRGMGL